METGSPGITALLRDYSAGNKSAFDEIATLVYPELQRIAAVHLRTERSGHTLEPGALVHEAYIRLVRARGREWAGRAHFFSTAAKVMRQILVDYGRRRRTQKRSALTVPGLEGERTDLRPVCPSALDDALSTLARIDSRKSDALELRYFGGLEMAEIAQSLGCSLATLRREMRLAEAWLHRELSSERRTLAHS
jgi:RNA polymerase sigma factor (TIGR02999 family)